MKGCVRIVLIDCDDAGGTLGLFTGMSILSMFEIVFWVGKGTLATLGKGFLKKNGVVQDRK